MVERNPNLARYEAEYLFVEVFKRKEQLLAQNPTAKVISLGVGDTTEPVPQSITQAMQAKAEELAHGETYTGYGPPAGDPLLREGIAQQIYKGRVFADDLFISDGAKCDLGRLQLLFGPHCSVAIQDPSYPVYVAASVMSGKSGAYDEKSGQYENIAYLPCRPDNAFFPDLEALPRTDLIYICSPNNPTGTVLTHAQLQELVSLAKKRGSLIVFDSAYSAYIQDPSLPKSIYEVEGADEVAIETASFSKLAGFTGVRLGWTVVPKNLLFADGSSVRSDWMKVTTTFFNGASNVAQAGGRAIITDEGVAQCQEICRDYLENAQILKGVVEERGYRCYGGTNAPYLWVDMNGESSWEWFDRLLNHAHLVTTPGIGFGPAGEGFLRLSAFGARSAIEEAAARLFRFLDNCKG